MGGRSLSMGGRVPLQFKYWTYIFSHWLKKIHIQEASRAEAT